MTRTGSGNTMHRTTSAPNVDALSHLAKYTPKPSMPGVVDGFSMPAVEMASPALVPWYRTRGGFWRRTGPSVEGPGTWQSSVWPRAHQTPWVDPGACGQTAPRP